MLAALPCTFVAHFSHKRIALWRHSFPASGFLPLWGLRFPRRTCIGHFSSFATREGRRSSPHAARMANSRQTRQLERSFALYARSATSGGACAAAGFAGAKLPAFVRFSSHSFDALPPPLRFAVQLVLPGPGKAPGSVQYQLRGV
jgi:hypothetical protein